MTDTRSALEQQRARPKQDSPRARAIAALAPRIDAVVALGEEAAASAVAAETRRAAEEAEAAQRAVYDRQYAECRAQGWTAAQLAEIGLDLSPGAAGARPRASRRPSQPRREAPGTAGDADTVDDSPQSSGPSDGDRPERVDPSGPGASPQIETVVT